jgi:hypothetical protein
MAILESYFYHGTIRKYTTCFGSLFNKIQIKKDKSSKLVLVPIQYQMKDKQNVRRDIDDPTSARYQDQLPRMSFNRDPSRMKSPFATCSTRNVVNGSVVGKSQLMRIPFTFQYELAIKTKYLEEMYQILEQILVWFNDSITINIKDNDDLDGTTAVTLSLDSLSPDNVFDGIMEDTNSIETTLSFNLQGYLYGPTSSAGFIEKVIINYYDYEEDVTTDSIKVATDTITESGVVGD